jgi:hypothetical protein
VCRRPHQIKIRLSSSHESRVGPRGSAKEWLLDLQYFQITMCRRRVQNGLLTPGSAEEMHLNLRSGDCVPTTGPGTLATDENSPSSPSLAATEIHLDLLATLGPWPLGHAAPAPAPTNDLSLATPCSCIRLVCHIASDSTAYPMAFTTSTRCLSHPRLHPTHRRRGERSL